MTATHGEGVYGNAAGVTTPLDHKMAQLGHVVKTAANTIRPGLFWDGSATIVSGKANMSYDVRAFTCVTSRGATAGAVFLSNDATYNVVTTAAPGSNSRYDVVYIWQREYSIDGTDSNPVIGVVQGTSAASPTVPSLSSYPGAIELARILVPAGVTATNSGTTITQTAPFTAMEGGVVPLRNTTERGAGTWIESQVIWLIDTDVLQVTADGTNWSTIIAGDTTGSVTLQSGFTLTSGYTSKLEKIGNLVSLNFAIDTTSGVGAGAGTIIATLPAGFRPANPTVLFCGSNNSRTIIIPFTIDSSGNLRAYPISSIGATGTLYGCVTFSVV